MFTY
jgi:ornithine--oxo-acid transaminase